MFPPKSRRSKMNYQTSDTTNKTMGGEKKARLTHACEAAKIYVVKSHIWPNHIA